MEDRPDDPILVGRVIKPHGIRGEVVVEPETDNPDRFSPGARLWLGPSMAPHTVDGARLHGGRWVVALLGIDTRDRAEALRGQEVVVDSSELPELETDSFWIHDLVGCRLERPDGEVLGTVEDVVISPRGGHDWLRLDEGPGGGRLVPMLRHWLVRVDLEAGTIVMDLPDGI